MRISHRILLAALAAPALAGAQQAAPAIETSELVRRVSRALDSLNAIDEFSGAVMIVRGSDTVFRRAVGMSDRERGLPNDVGTKFNIGSINKAFTAIAIRQLAEEGKLHLDSTLGVYWPDYPNPAARGVTIRQLLRHTSGIGGNIFSSPPGKTRRDMRHNSQFVQLFATSPLLFAPGSKSQYSNAGYVILGELVQRLSGEDYYEYVRKHIYVPAGMTETGHLYVDSLPQNTARGYTRRGGGSAAKPHANSDILPGRGSAAGGGYSTAGDLIRFVRALREHRIPGGGPAGIGIAGGAEGLNGVIEADLPGGYDVVVLANLDPPAAERVGAMIRKWLGAKDD